MRGKKALTLQATSLLDDSITIVPHHWADAAKAIERLFHSRNQIEDFENFLLSYV